MRYIAWLLQVDESEYGMNEPVEYGRLTAWVYTMVLLMLFVLEFIVLVE